MSSEEPAPCVEPRSPPAGGGSGPGLPFPPNQGNPPPRSQPGGKNAVSTALTATGCITAMSAGVTRNGTGRLGSSAT